MAAVVFAYGATTCTFSRNPDIGEFDVRRKYMNPRSMSAGGVAFVYDKGLSMDVHKLSWKRMKAADFASLMTFLDAVDGGANPFDYTDVAGTTKPAFILNAGDIRSTPAWYMTEEVSIELLLAPPNILLDETGAILCDETYKALLEEDTIPKNALLDEANAILTDEDDCVLFDETDPAGLLDEVGEYLLDENNTILMEE